MEDMTEVVTSAFRDVNFPGASKLWYALTDDPVIPYFVDWMHGDHSWRHLLDLLMDDEADYGIRSVMFEAVSYMTLEGCLYYLPALLLFCITDIEDELHWTSVMSDYTPLNANDQPGIDHTSIGSRELIKFDLLTLEQKRVFLKLVERLCAKWDPCMEEECAEYSAFWQSAVAAHPGRPE